MAVHFDLRNIAAVTRPEPRLGELLVKTGDLSPDVLAQALAAQISARSPSRLGEILWAEGHISRAALLAALSRQSGIGRVDLLKAPPDPDLLQRIDPLVCLRHGWLPWRRIGNVTIVAIADPAQAEAILAGYKAPSSQTAIALADGGAIQRCLLDRFQADLTDRAAYLCPPEFACRALQSRWTLARLTVLLAAAVMLTSRFPGPILTALFGFLIAVNFATATLRLLAFGAMLLRPLPGAGTSPARPTDHRVLPVISILVPLFRESRVLAGLVESLARLDYPRDRLDVKLILETDDGETAAQLLACPLPNWMEVVEVPPGRIRTKPRAMNYALPLCRGAIIGIYDAEDRPEPDQLRKVATQLAAAAPAVACVQARLGFYNSRTGWMARCFAIEYAQWFGVLLPGLRRLGLPVPLGGTSVFFRRAVLERLGGWDAHNVTEDADLGMRLARRGYCCAMLDSTTHEEAVTSGRAWVRQRSRWLKGYAITWASHMRRPFVLMDDLGFAGFMAFQTLFLGTLTGCLAFPLHALLWVRLAGITLPFTAQVSPGIWFWLTTSHLVGLAGLVLVATRALLPRRHRHLLPVFLTMPLYWPLGSLAAWRALAESFIAPFYWAKTEHGVAQPLPAATAFSRTSKAAEM